MVPIRWANSLPLLLLSSCQVASWTHFNSPQFVNPLIERRKSSYKPTKKAKPESDSSDSSDDDDVPAGKKPQGMRKKSIKKGKGKHAKEGEDDVTAPTAAPERKAKKKNILTSMFKKEQEPEDVEWEANLDDFLTQKSSLTSFTDMIPTEHWDVFKDRVRKFRTVGTKVLEKKEDKKKAPAPAPKASDMIDPAKYMFQEDFLDLTPQNTNKLLERRKSTKQKPVAESSESSDSDSDDEEEEVGGAAAEPVKGGAKVSRAKSIKVAAKQSKEMRELEAGMDDFLKNKSSSGWFNTVNNATWEAFRKSVETLRNETEAARDAFKEKKPPQPSKLKKSDSGPDLLETLEKKKKKKKAEGTQAEEGTAESVHSKMRELEEELALEEQMQNAKTVAGKSSKTDTKRLATLKADINSLQQIAQNLNMVGALIF